jgi:hypothetical protein
MDATLRPADFACAMQAHWTNPDTLNNVSSPALMSLWTVMATTFAALLRRAASHLKRQDERRWGSPGLMIPLPTA